MVILRRFIWLIFLTISTVNVYAAASSTSTTAVVTLDLDAYSAQLLTEIGKTTVPTLQWLCLAKIACTQSKVAFDDACKRMVIPGYASVTDNMRYPIERSMCYFNNRFVVHAQTCNKEDNAIADRFLLWGASPNVRMRLPRYGTVAHNIACTIVRPESKCAQFVYLLESGTNFMLQDMHGNTVFHHLITNYCNVTDLIATFRACKRASKYSFDVNQINYDGKTLLDTEIGRWATGHINLDLMRYLLAEGANVKRRPIDGLAPILHTVIKWADRAIRWRLSPADVMIEPISLLVAAGADPMVKNEDSLTAWEYLEGCVGRSYTIKIYADIYHRYLEKSEKLIND